MKSSDSENESIEEIKHRLICTRLELIAARMEANGEVKKYEDTINRLYKLLKRVCQERDEARDQLQLLIRSFRPAETSSTIPQLDHLHPNHPPILNFKTKPSLVKKSSNTSLISDTSTSTTFSNGSCDLSLSNDKYYISSKQNHQNKKKVDNGGGGGGNSNMADGASLVIEKLASGKPLPNKGRLLQSVTEAGPLLSTLLVAPLPQWNNPPPPLSSSVGLSLCSIQGNNCLSTCNSDNKETIVEPKRFIPTSLTLAFPGNSSGPSQISPAPVKNEPMLYMDLDSNGMHNHAIAGKKRKFL